MSSQTAAGRDERRTNRKCEEGRMLNGIARLLVVAMLALTVLTACKDANDNQPIGATFPANRNSSRQGYTH
jgi:hypothetical protein